jgi:tetratricopeptide (TPR) repeat protein
VVLAGAAPVSAATAVEYHRRSFRAATPERRLELLDRALAMNPDHVPSLRVRAAVHSVRGDKEKALADAARAAELVPDDPQLNLLAGGLAHELQRYDQAAALFRRVVDADRLNLFARAQHIDALTKALRTDRALERANRLVQLRPQLDLSYSMRAEVYEWMDRFADGARDVSVLLSRATEDADRARYLLRRCILYRGMGEGQKALADAEQVMRIRSEGSYMYAARGCSYEILGKKEAALADYQRAARLARAEKDDTRFFTIWQCILLRKLGRRDEADQLAREYVKDELEKKDEWVAPVLRYLAGQMNEDEVFRRARHENPVKNREQMCEATYYIGACHMAAGDLDKAQKLFRQTITLRVHNFYEHGFALRDLREIRKQREAKKTSPADPAEQRAGDREHERASPVGETPP